MKIVKDWFRRYANDPQVVVLFILLVLFFVVVLTLGGVLLPVMASIVIAYLLESVVQFFQRRRLPRLPAVLLVYFGFLATLVLLALFVVPLISRQASQALAALPEMVDTTVEGIKVHIFGENGLLSEYEVIDEQQLKSFQEGIKTSFQDGVGKMAQQFVQFSLSSVQGLIVLFVYLILMPILVFFMLKDKTRILRWFQRFLPRERRLSVTVWADVDRQIGNYVRGKVWEILIVGGAAHITFTFLDLPYRVLLAILVGFSVIVPYVGATVVTFPVLFVAYSEFGFESGFWWTFTAYMILQALDGNVLVPLLFSEVVSLHPIAIISAVLIFGGMWGFWGVFFAIPLATLVQAVLKAWPRKRRPRDRGGGDQPELAEAPAALPADHDQSDDGPTREARAAS